MALNSNTGTLRKQMMQQFAHGSALSGFNAGAMQLATPTRLQAIASAQTALDNDDGTDVARCSRALAQQEEEAEAHFPWSSHGCVHLKH